jgi:hypothetical protein
MVLSTPTAEEEEQVSAEEDEVPPGHQPVPRAVALALGGFLTLFGSVFFFFPLFGLIAALSSATSLGEIVLFVAFFSVFLVVGAGVMLGGLYVLLAGITGNNLPTYSTEPQEDHLGDGEPVNTAFAYTNRDELLAEIHGTASEDNEASGEAERSEQADAAKTEQANASDGAFWDLEATSQS